MSMYAAIKDMANQFAFEPEIVNSDKLHSNSKYALVGMGGSHLAADLLKTVKPEADLIIHSNYGLPDVPDLKDRLIILSSHSGNTEEVLDAYQKAGQLGLSRVVVSTNGKLLELAKKDGVAYVQMPDLGIQPRSALPLSLKSLLKIINEEQMLAEASELQSSFVPQELEEVGKALAEKLHGHVPIIYCSEENAALGYNWKIKFNETGKVPAFYNVFPELNHNELAGFNVKDSTRHLSEKFYFLFLADSTDDARIQKRMKVTAQLLEERSLPTYEIKLSGKNVFHKIFNSLALADWAAYFTAEGYGLDPEQVPIVEQFKELIK